MTNKTKDDNFFFLTILMCTIILQTSALKIKIVRKFHDMMLRHKGRITNVANTI